MFSNRKRLWGDGWVVCADGRKLWETEETENRMLGDLGGVQEYLGKMCCVWGSLGVVSVDWWN